MRIKIEGLENRMEKSDARLDKIEEQLAGKAQGSSSGMFKPTHIEIKGFCEWNKRKEKGICRAEAEELLKKLTQKLPGSVQGKVGVLEMFGVRCHKFRVNVTVPHAVEVGMAFKQYLQEDDSLQFDGRTLYATIQREPEEEKRVRTSAMILSFMESKVKEKDSGATVKCTWKPDFKIKIMNSQGTGCVIGAVADSGVMEWDEAVVQANLGCASGDIDAAMKAARSK